MTSLVVLGLNHRTSPVELLERLAVPDESLPKALHQLMGYEHVLEGAVLSTCNRIEVCALVSRFHGGAQDLRNFLAEFCHIAPEDFSDHLYTYHDDGAARHLFRVAAGVDSMIVGEPEILGQVRRAFHVASQEGSARRVLGHAFRQALSVGKRARTETAIARNPVSFSSAAVDLARRALPGGLGGHERVLIVGAGRVGRLTLQALRTAGIGDFTIVSRTEDSARAAAEREGARMRPIAELESALSEADVVVCSTTSPQIVLERSLVERVLTRGARARPLFIMDMAVPRDVEPSTAELPAVVLRDIDDLRVVVESNFGSRVAEISRVEDIIAAEIERFVQWQQADEVAPTIAALVARADAIREVETGRARRTLASLSSDQREAVDHLTRRIVAKLLHAPIQRTRGHAGSKQGHVFLETVRELFELDDDLSG